MAKEKGSPSNKVRTKLIKRNKNKGKQTINCLNVLYANANGIRDKMVSIQSAAEEYDAHIVAITETKINPPKLQGYGKWKSKERKQRAGGGVAITARNDINNKVTKVTNLEDDEQEVVWVELKKNMKDKIYIGTYYGKQEKAPREEIEREFSQLSTQISALKKKGEVIITGDFNAKININEGDIKQKLSPNGKQL